MLRGVIFDLDDTLYNASFCYAKGYEALAVYVDNTFGIRKKEFEEQFAESRKIIKGNLGNVASSHNRLLYIQKYLETIGESPVVYALDMYELFWNTVLEYAELYDYVIPLFNELKDKRIVIALLSDLTSYIQHKKIRKLGIDSYIDVLVTSEEVGVEKPSHIMFDYVIKKMQIDAESVVMIGDSYERDIEGAKAVGIRAIHFVPGLNILQEVERLL